MNFRISGLLAIAGFALAGILGSAQSFAQNAYITNQGPYPFTASTVSVIDTATNMVTATIPVGPASIGVAASPDGKVYVTNLGNNSVSDQHGDEYGDRHNLCL
jgi:YVTN family beta-propeller protein